MKISYGIYQDLKGTPCAARPGHSVQCYALRYPRASLAVPGIEAPRGHRHSRSRGRRDDRSSRCNSSVCGNIMAHGVNEVLCEESAVKMVHQKQPQQQQQQNVRKSVGVMGSRRIFAPAFKLKVLDSYRNDIDCRGNQRATARKYGIHRRQIQKWLQCEDNLRNSCAESSNSNIAVAPTTVIPSASVPKADGISTETTGPAVTPATPALNLSLARLHGDELATQQGSPPLLPRPPHDGSPSSPQYGPRNTTTGAVLPLRVTSGYPEYPSGHEQHRLRHEIEQRQSITEIHNYSETRIDQERNYYVLNTDVTHESHDPSSIYAGRNEVKVYQTLTTYRSVHQDHRYGGNNVDRSVHHSPEHQDQRDQSYGDARSSVEGKTYSLLLAPSMIKAERASPDSVATPGPYESTCSPVAPRGLLSPLSHQATGNGSVGDGSNTSTLLSVHFESPRVSASPCMRVHVREQHAHTSPTSDSEKPIPCLQERESRETSSYTQERGEGENNGEKEEFYRAVVKKEVHLDEEEPIDEDREGTVTSSCIECERPSVGTSLGDSGSVSSAQDREGIYSTPSSPRGPSSSGRSSGTCSDSEMDPLDCSSGSQHSSSDLTRRRSFSLRFKLDVLDAFHRDVGVAGNQRATARKFGINRRQVQKWLGQETELRGEIALRGNSRQRLGPVQDATSGESPVDLRTTNFVPAVSHDRIDIEYERSPQPPYCCEFVPPTSHQPYYQRPNVSTDASSEIDPGRTCTLSCCVDTTSAASCYQEATIRGPCRVESQGTFYCYSPRDYTEAPVRDSPEPISSPLKRPHCTLSCCYEPTSSPKQLCLDIDDVTRNSCRNTPPQETPLCLVKPKKANEGPPSRLEQRANTVPTPPSAAAAAQEPPNNDAILFKPYLDNPVSKSKKEHVNYRGLSPLSNLGIINNNNNCHSICNLNEDSRGHDYALELSLRVPLSWRAQQLKQKHLSEMIARDLMQKKFLELVPKEDSIGT